MSYNNNGHHTTTLSLTYTTVAPARAIIAAIAFPASSPSAFVEVGSNLYEGKASASPLSVNEGDPDGILHLQVEQRVGLNLYVGATRHL